MDKYFGYPPKCDNCGKFHKPTAGAAWLRIPACDIPGEYGSEEDRCAKCVENIGGFNVSAKYKAGSVTGIYT
jgi:hypothetical protein